MRFGSPLLQPPDDSFIVYHDIPAEAAVAGWRDNAKEL